MTDSYSDDYDRFYEYMSKKWPLTKWFYSEGIYNTFPETPYGSESIYTSNMRQVSLVSVFDRLKKIGKFKPQF